MGTLIPNGYGCVVAGGCCCCCSSWQRAKYATQALRHVADLCSDTTTSVCITNWHMPGARHAFALSPRVGREQRWDANGSGRTPEGVLAHKHKKNSVGRKSLITRKATPNVAPHFPQRCNNPQTQRGHIMPLRTPGHVHTSHPAFKKARPRTASGPFSQALIA